MNVELPIFTTIVEAEPWEKGHVARITSSRVTHQSPAQPRIIAEGAIHVENIMCDYSH